MRAVVYHGVGDIRLEEVPEPTIREPTDAIVRLTASAICGTDLHFVRGTMPGTKEGRILGHEGVGVVEEIGEHVRNLTRGGLVVLLSTIGCGPGGQVLSCSALYLGAGRVIAADAIPDRLEEARRQGAEIVDFEDEDPVGLIAVMSRGIGPHRVIDAVGVDANRSPEGDDERF